MIQLKKIKKFMDNYRGKFLLFIYYIILIIYYFYKLSSNDTIKKK